MVKATGRAGVAIFLTGVLTLLTLTVASSQDFDQGVDAGPILEKARAGAEAKVARADLGLSRGPVITNGMGSGLFSVTEADLPRISSLMHEKYGRCGGFFSYDSKECLLTNRDARLSEIQYQGLLTEVHTG